MENERDSLNLHSEIIAMARKRTIFEVDKLFGQNEEIKVIKKTESLIEFEKGSIWSTSLSPKKAFLQGTIHFEGDTKTNISIDYDRTKINWIMGFSVFVIILCAIFLLGTSVWYTNSMADLHNEMLGMSVFMDIYYMNKGWGDNWMFTLFAILTMGSTKPFLFGTWLGISFLVILIPLIAYYLRYYKKAETIFSKELFLHLTNVSYDKP